MSQLGYLFRYDKTFYILHKSTSKKVVFVNFSYFPCNYELFDTKTMLILEFWKMLKNFEKKLIFCKTIFNTNISFLQKCKHKGFKIYLGQYILHRN